MKRLLMISTDRKIFEQGSAVRARMVEYGRSLDELHIIIFAKRGAGFVSEKISDTVNVYPTQSRTRLGYIFDAVRTGKGILGARAVLGAGEADFQISCQDPFETGLAGVFLAKRFSLPLELQIHTDIGSPYFGYSLINKVRSFLASYTIPKASRVRVVSHRIKNYLVEHLKTPLERIEVRPIKIDIEKLKASPITVDLHKKYPGFRKIVLMASRLEREKSINFALQVWQQVSLVVPDTLLLVVGSGREERVLQTSVQKLGLEKTVVFEPWTSELASYYKTADVFLLTSLFEGYGMTLVEASVLGRPIVSSDVGVASELSGTYVCRVNDTNCFINTLTTLLVDTK